MTQMEVKGRLAEAVFEIEYADGTIARLPVLAKRAESLVGDEVVETFRADRGQILQTGPGRHGVWLDPSKYEAATWFKIRWRFSHPTRGIEAGVTIDYFFRSVEDVVPADAGVHPDRIVSEPGSFSEPRHLIAREIIRREALLLRRFNGSFCAFLLRRQDGKQCPLCYDFTLKRTIRSNCRRCYDTGFDGGYSQPYYGWVFHWDPAQSLRPTQMGDVKTQRGAEDWTTAYPKLSAGDVFVLRDGSRWRIMDPRSTKMEGEGGAHPVRQIFEVSRLAPTDVLNQFPVPDLRRPVDSFVGFMAGETRQGESGVVFHASGLL